MRHVENFPHSVVEHQDWGITLSDGCRLSARVWMPEDAVENPVPVILEHLPYRKRDGTIVRDQFTHPWFAGHGYCCIRTDMRGSGESQGLLDDEYTQQELDDACEVIAWAAAQPWCNGSIGMMGISWGGFNGVQVAALAPPALKAVITLCSTADRYADDIHYKGGCLLTENFGWSSNMLSYSSRPPDPALVGEGWKDIWLNRLKHQPWHLSDWLKHQTRNDYWKHGSVCEDYSSVKAAVLSIGGWHDGYRNTISHLVENLASPVKGIVGPWNHKYPHYAGPKPAIGFLQEAKRWWDRWLKDEETGVENDPAYRAFLMDSVAPQRWFDERPGRWIAEQKWPSPTIDQNLFHLSADGSLSATSGNDAAKTTGLQINSPQDCGKMGGEYFPFAFSDELPDEQSPDDALSLCFDSESLDDPLDIVGAPFIRLRLSSDKPKAQLAVRLCDLRPDGSSAHITFGVLNLTHSNSHEAPSFLKPGEVFDIELALDQIAYRLPQGHRLRVALSTSYWPTLWPMPEAATLTLVEGSLSVPSRPLSDGAEWEFEEPEGAPAWQAETLRDASYSRTVHADDETGIVKTMIFSDSGENRDSDHGLISGSWVKECFTIHPDDPLSANATAEWEQTGGRPGQMWRTHVLAQLHGDSDSLNSQAVLTAYENGQQVFQHTYHDSQTREFL